MPLTIERMDYEQRLVALQNVVAQLMAQQQVAPLLAITLKFLQTYFDYPLIWFARYDDHHKTLQGHTGCVPHPDKAPDILQQSIPVLPGDCFDQVLVTGQPIFLASLKQEPRAGQWQSWAQQLDIQGALVFGLKSHQHVNGILLMGSHLWGGNPRTIDVAHVGILSSTLGNTWHQCEQRNTSTPEALSARLLEQVATRTGVEGQLLIVLQHLFEHLQPTQTSFLWFDVDRQCFWQRLLYRSSQERRYQTLPSGKIEIALDELKDCRLPGRPGDVLNPDRSIIKGQTLPTSIVIDSSVQTASGKTTTQLLQKFRRRALLLAPLVIEEHLWGLIVVESAEQRQWRQWDRSLVQGAAELARVITAPEIRTHPLPRNGKRTLGHRALGQRRERIDDIRQTLSQAQDAAVPQSEILNQMGRHLHVSHVLLLRCHPQPGETTEPPHRFDVECQFQGAKQRSPLLTLPALSKVDVNLLRRSNQAIVISHLEQDLRFLNWRQPLWDHGIHAIVVTRILHDGQLDLVLVVGATTARHWKPEDTLAMEQVTAALQQANQHQREQQQQQQQLRIMTLLHQGLSALHHWTHADEVETTMLDLLSQLLQVPLAMIIRWEPDQRVGEVAACHATLPELDIPDPTAVRVLDDPILQTVMQSPPPQVVDGTWEGIECVALADQASPPSWLPDGPLKHLLVMPWRDTSMGPLLGVVVFGALEERSWASPIVQAAGLLVRSWANHHHLEQNYRQVLHQHVQLECLNWYKYRQFEQIGQALSTNKQQLQTHQTKPSTQLVCAQGQHCLEELTKIVRTEHWHLDLDEEAVSVAMVLKQVLARIEHLANQRQLVIQSHNLSGASSPWGVSPKLTVVLYELLLAACYRSQPNQRIDLWCRLSNADWLELSITDQGRFNPQLMEALNRYGKKTEPDLHDSLEGAMLAEPPGLHLRACQTLIKHLEGHMEFAQLEDARVLSRLMVPIQLE